MIIIGRLWYQYQTAAGTDSGFPIGDGADFPGAANLQFCQNFQKTAWDWENFWAMGGGRAPTYNFAKFSQKLHEIEKILGHGRGAPA